MQDKKRKEELKLFIDREFQGSQKAFAKAIGISNGRVSQYLSDRESFGERAASMIEKKIGRSIFKSLEKSKRSQVPIVGYAKLGDENAYFVELDYPVGSGDGYIEYASRDLNAYALKCFGDSMKPRIRHGEYVIIEPNHAISPGDEVLVIDKQGRVMIKVWNYCRDGFHSFSSINDAFAPFGIPEQDIEKMQFVSAIAKSALKKEY